jgi:hypothetical protein
MHLDHTCPPANGGKDCYLPAKVWVALQPTRVPSYGDELLVPYGDRYWTVNDLPGTQENQGQLLEDAVENLFSAEGEHIADI